MIFKSLIFIVLIVPLAGQAGLARAGGADLVAGAAAAAPDGGTGAEVTARNWNAMLGEAGNDVVFQSLALLGIDYRHGGRSPPTGLDCSGLVRYVYREAQGIELPNTSREMSRVGVTVGRDALAPGDLVFYNTLRRAFSHVGIYLGGNRFIHAPSTGGEVRIDDMTSSYWAKRFDGARRIRDNASLQ